MRALLIIWFLGTSTGVFAQQQINTYNGGNGANGSGDYGILTQATGGQALIGAEGNGDLYANLNLGSVVSGIRRFWHLSKRTSSENHNLNYYFYDGTTFQHRVTFATSGNVGIGTPNPEAKFTITQIGNGWNDGLRINRDASNYLTLTEDVTDVRLKNWGSGGLLFYTSSTLAAAITNNGNVGIGAAVPEQKLDVRGNLVLEAGTNPVLYTGTGSAEQNRFLQLINSTSYGSASGLKAGGVLIADTYAYGNPGKNDLIVKGSIGIGTATPGSYKLAVEGKIGAREVNVTTNAWSDYVFSADYKLRPLAEVQQYIDENHHLPEVPSEKEVLANGQNLGEMNAILLKKVEELTLYVIELKLESETAKQRDEQQVKEVQYLRSIIEKLEKK